LLADQIPGKLIHQIKNYYGIWRQLFGPRFLIKIFMLVSMPVLLVGFFFSQARCAVVAGDEVVAVAADRETAMAAVEEFISRREEAAGMPVMLFEEIKYRPTWRLTDAAGKEEIIRGLSRHLSYGYKATGIFADGKMVALVEDRAAGNRVLHELLHMYSEQGKLEVSFKQRVELKPVALGDREPMSVEEALEHIRFGGSKARSYKVKQGDTLWDIAAAVNLPVEELQLANPGLDPEALQVGQEITVSPTSPLIDVLAAYTDTRREEVLYRVQEKVDKNLFLGERKIVQQGQPGLREVVYRVVLENGVEVHEEIIAEKIIKEPVPQIVAKGTRKLLAFRGGNGRLAYPAAGAIVSPFGTRWGRFHSGVDIAASYGSPVVAAESGTVTRAGYYGGYGLCIDINHGGGVVTRYAHLSSAAVKPGQKVERGQFIGRAGASGHATGPHLHFEVIVDGVHKNPSLFF